MTREDRPDTGRDRRIEPRIDWTRIVAAPRARRDHPVPAWRDRRYWRWSLLVALLLVDAMRETAGLSESQWAAAHAQLFTMAVERQVAINADHPYVQAFWELFEHLDSNTQQESLDHSRNGDYVAVSLVEFEARAHKAGLGIPGGDITELKRFLRTSRRRKFHDIKTVNSKVTGGSKKCWIFKMERD